MIELLYKLRAKVIVCTNNTINKQKKDMNKATTKLCLINSFVKRV